MKRTGYMEAVLALFPALCLAGELKPVALAAPETDGGKPLMQVLKERKSVREFGPGALPMQVLSNLLWAAAGVNRADGRRTAPTASNRQEIDVYVAAADGLYLYDAKGHRLEPVLAEDIRAATGTQAYVRDAAVNLIYVADFAKMGQSSPENKVLYSAADTGFISQNVYLFCASQGLATVVRASVDRDALAKTMKLRPEQRITLAHSVGFVKK